MSTKIIKPATLVAITVTLSFLLILAIIAMISIRSEQAQLQEKYDTSLEVIYGITTRQTVSLTENEHYAVLDLMNEYLNKQKDDQISN